MSKREQFKAPGRHGAKRRLIESGDPVEVEQERFNRFIRAENERLNRLIRNLYLYFQLEHYRERDLYDRICQEVAEYFRAASCELYIVRYEEKEYKDQEETSPGDGGKQGKRRHLTKWLELVGAVGPARRALRQQYVRHRSRSMYRLPGALQIERSDSGTFTDVVRRGFMKEGPTRYSSAYEFPDFHDDSAKQGEPDELPRLESVAPRQVVWYQDGLYNTFRCSMMAPLAREKERDADDSRLERQDGESASQEPLDRQVAVYREIGYRKIGLIKVENRSPYGVTRFSDVPPDGSSQHPLLFEAQWRIAALCPYIWDLQEAKNPFLPLHNNIGWHQYFEEHPMGVDYFHQLIRELRRLREGPDASAVARDLPKKYKALALWLEDLVECLIRLESWLQHLWYACRLICNIAGQPSSDKPAPSLFNAYNLCAAGLAYHHEDSPPPSGSAQDRPAEQNHYMYDVLWDVLLDCASKEDGTAESTKRGVKALADLLPAFEKLARSLDIVLKQFENNPSPPQPDDGLVKSVASQQRRLVERLKKLKEHLTPEKWDTLRNLSAHLQALNPLRSQPEELEETLFAMQKRAASIRLFIEQEVADILRRLIESRAEAMRRKLGISNNPFKIEVCLNSAPPRWEFQPVLEEILEDLRVMCAALKAGADERVREYELASEEAEVSRISGDVYNILRRKDEHTRRHETIRAGWKAARALAAATMYADSFDQIDERRLIFICNHIVQVLDNHLLHQARQRELDLDFGALNDLGLEHFGLELLDALFSCAQRIEPALHYLVEREAYRSQELIPLWDSKPLRLKALKEAVNKYARGDPDQDEWICLVTISSPSERTGQTVLRQVCHRGETLHDLEMRPAREPQRNQPLQEVTFLPGKNLSTGAERALAEIALRLSTSTENAAEAAGAHRIKVLVRFKKEALHTRDLRALWAAVRALEDALKAVEATIGGAVC